MTKKTNTTKANTAKETNKKKVEEVAKKETEAKKTVVEQPVAVEQAPKPRVRKRLDENMLVDIASGVQGGLTYISKDGNTILKFLEYGDQDVIELKELRRMLSSSRKFLEKGWIRVLDDEVIEYLNLHRFQQENVEQDDLDGLLKLQPEQVLETVKSANANTKRLIFGFVKDKYISGEAIEEGLGETLDPNS